MIVSCGTRVSHLSSLIPHPSSLIPHPKSQPSTIVPTLLPHIPRTSIPISIPNQKPNQKLMRSPARRAEIGSGEVVSITHIKCISNIQSRHCRKAIELPDTSTSPQEVAVLKLHI